MNESHYLTTAYIGIILLLCSCENRELSADDPCVPVPTGNKLIEVVIHWENTPVNTRPDRMNVLWYAAEQYPYIGDYKSAGGYEMLSDDLFTPLCTDLYGNASLDFRNTDVRESLEIFNIPRKSLYNEYADPVPGEPTVAEATPYSYYVDSEAQSVDMDTRLMRAGDTLRVHFYPENVLREFTFLIYGVEGARNMARNSGAVSGMSASYFPAGKTLADKPSTILFSRITPIRDGQGYNWTQVEKELFARKNALWQDSDSFKGWTGDWVTGKFSTFGPVDAANRNIRLTVEAMTDGSRYYYGAWGYWYGKWEETVGTQILGAMGGPNGKGTCAEQLAWREQNGGFDIILYNDGRLVVPEEPGNGGFIVGSDAWDDYIPVPGKMN
ncbi:hypothetical protein AGMMS49574_29050 [Bacteroidia bacterium]|nr:hypothetical protein AGMMS49574_29050 [Bacteroidia bacterium]